MSEFSGILYKIKDKLVNGFKNRDYILAGTRILSVNLYDHLILKEGIVVATLKELLMVGKATEEICVA
nr:hypothetical protein [Candidatus Freyarchaeota archaeon]